MSSAIHTITIPASVTAQVYDSCKDLSPIERATRVRARIASKLQILELLDGADMDCKLIAARVEGEIKGLQLALGMLGV